MNPAASGCWLHFACRRAARDHEAESFPSNQSWLKRRLGSDGDQKCMPTMNFITQRSASWVRPRPSPAFKSNPVNVWSTTA